MGRLYLLFPLLSTFCGLIQCSVIPSDLAWNNFTGQSDRNGLGSISFSTNGKKCLNKCDCYEESFKECMVVDNWWPRSDEYEPCTPRETSNACGKEDDGIQDEQEVIV